MAVIKGNLTTGTHKNYETEKGYKAQCCSRYGCSKELITHDNYITS
jgi:hypothetical protein